MGFLQPKPKTLISEISQRCFTFSIRSFLLIVMHLFKRSLYFSRSFCCSSICLLRSQFACRKEEDFFLYILWKIQKISLLELGYTKSEICKTQVIFHIKSDSVKTLYIIKMHSIHSKDSKIVHKRYIYLTTSRMVWLHNRFYEFKWILTRSRSSILPSFFSRSRFLLLSMVASFTTVRSVYRTNRTQFNNLW